MANPVFSGGNIAGDVLPDVTGRKMGSLTQLWNFFAQKVNFAGSSSGQTIVQAAATASGTLTLPAATDTLVGKATTDTLTNKTLTSPTINGNPSGTGISTLTLKSGSGAGNYGPTASTTYVRVDSTNLAYTVTVPTGWKLFIQASGDVGTNTAVVFCNVALADGVADNTGILKETVLFGPSIANAGQFALGYVLTGDGAAHTINLQYKTSNAADTAFMVNSSATLNPSMVCILSPSN